MENIKNTIIESIQVKQLIASDDKLIQRINEVAELCIACYKNGGKTLFCGNGGSAADAQHLAAELSGRFYYDREPLDSEALHVNTSYVTAVGNDYSYDEIYARSIKGQGKKGDVLIGISTSGNSKNIVRAFEVAKDLGMFTVALTGETGGAMKEKADFLLNVPSKITPRIQESHILIGHILCEIIEAKLFPQV
ncbi:D-sedoheptulose-7-phosphate isomerase [Maribacter sp. IgM3_T14_3]|uniref:D-sedoheptulose-7-phosphate isomerase n=1 Tax=Maribacter sp. IgM3_T14_3 TaxID=3415140 RepID=UPI003C7022A7